MYPTGKVRVYAGTMLMNKHLTLSQKYTLPNQKVHKGSLKTFPYSIVMVMFMAFVAQDITAVQLVLGACAVMMTTLLHPPVHEMPKTPIPKKSKDKVESKPQTEGKKNKNSRKDKELPKGEEDSQAKADLMSAEEQGKEAMLYYDPVPHFMGPLASYDNATTLPTSKDAPPYDFFQKPPYPEPVQGVTVFPKQVIEDYLGTIKSHKRHSSHWITTIPDTCPVLYCTDCGRFHLHILFKPNEKHTCTCSAPLCTIQDAFGPKQKSIPPIPVERKAASLAEARKKVLLQHTVTDGNCQTDYGRRIAFNGKILIQRKQAVKHTLSMSCISQQQLWQRH